MSFTCWLRNLRSACTPGRAGPNRRSPSLERLTRFRLRLEALEDRMLLSYTLTPIADTGPGSPYSGLPVGQAINDRGQVALVAVLKSGGEAVYRTEGDGSLTAIARTDGLIRDFYLSPYMNDSGTVSFGADLTDGAQALFTGSGGDLTRIADTEPASPFSTIPNPAARIDARGEVYFRATMRSGETGFFAGDGGPTSTLYVTGGEFSAFPSSLAHQVHGEFGSFRATLSGGPAGVFKGNGSATETLVTAGGLYRDFFGAEINDPGTVAIPADLTAGGQALLVAENGALRPFVDTTGPYSQILPSGQLSINNGGEIAFGATLKAGGRGFFDGPDPVADKIVAIGDGLAGSTVVGFPQNSMNPRSLNDAGEFLFRATLADGRIVLAVAEPDGEGQGPRAADEDESATSSTQPHGALLAGADAARDGVFNGGAATLGVLDSLFTGDLAQGGDGIVGSGAAGTGYGGTPINQGIALPGGTMLSANEAIGGDSTGLGGDGPNGGLFTDAAATLTVTDGAIIGNRADGGSGAPGSSDGTGPGGGLYIVPSGIACIDPATVIGEDTASTKDNEVFGLFSIDC